MSIASQAKRVAKLLTQRRCKVVFAESCTGGFVSGSLTQVPGISDHLCGAMVVYRSATKAAWLGLPDKDLRNPGPVSQKVTRLLAEQVLRQTPEADLSLAVTGHLGPKAPKRLDGIVFFHIAWREGDGRLKSVSTRSARYPAGLNRQQRQRRAVEDALKLLGDYLLSRQAESGG